MLANVNPVLDPLTLTPLRNAVIHSAWGRGKKDLPPGIAKKLNDTFVVTSSAPVAPPFRRNLARDMRVESADKRFGNRQFKVRDERGQSGVSQTAPVANSVEERTQRAESPRGNDGQSQRRIENAMQQTQAERARASQQAQGERVGRPAKQQVQREVARPASPSVRREPGNVRIERPAQPVHQPKQQMRQAQPPRAMERPGQPVRQQGPVQQQVRQPAPKANVNPARPVHGQGQGQGQGQQKVEQKQGGAPAKAQPASGGKGKGKKP
jgi:hypothetical protein